MTAGRLLPITLVAVAMALALPGGKARAEEGVDYAPVPPAIAAVIADAEEQALADFALELLGQAEQSGTIAPNVDWPRSLLVMLGDAGLKAAAERLASGEASDLMKRHLLAVVAASEHPDADALLQRAAAEPLPSLRMIAAQGLGHGRTAGAVSALATLARDARSGVRASALRALFAIDSPHARAARIALPEDVVPELVTERLRRHRQVGDVGPTLRDLALRCYHDGRRARMREEAARLLARPAIGAPVETLERIVLEMGTDVLGAGVVRFALRVPARGYDSVTERRAAIEAALTLIGHDDATEAQRTLAIERAVGWIAKPVRMDPYKRDPIPEEVLRRRLPDVGPRLVEPVVKRLREGRFYLTQHGVGLLRDLGPRTALPVFERLLGEPNTDAMHEEIALVMATWGRIGGEPVATRLLAAPLEEDVRLELVEALRREPATWALPKLKLILAKADEDMRRRARITLERRPEPEARTWLVEDVFTRAEDVDDRLPQLLRPIDDYAWSVITRALGDPRYVFQHEALVLLAKPAFRDARGASLLAGYAPNMTKPRHVQDYLYALINQNPMEAVRFVRSNWDTLPQPKSSLRLLQEIWGAAPIRAAVDLALELVKDSDDMVLLTKAGAVLAGHAGHRDAEIGALWRKTLTLPDDDLRTSTLLNIAYKGCPDLSAELVPMLDKARKREALLGTSSELDEAVRAQHVLSAMRYQRWADVEAAVVGTILDPVAHPEVRVHAARVAIGKLSDDARTKLLGWLAGASANPNAKAKGASAGGALQLRVAQAVGAGGDAAVAERLYRALFDEHTDFYKVALRLDPSHLRKTAFDRRVLALGTGVAATRHGPSVRAMVGLLFAPQYSTYASRAIRLQSDGANRGGPAAGALRTTSLPTLLHADDRAFAVLAPDAEALLSSLRAAPDAMLESAFRDTLEAGRRSG
ncbi:MAG: HEAT repeat domain-containing protein, partial [Planctomycetota bacterium]|nr:HEAT repeat domain-containing protein [Planctomycetota bacterium]